MVSGTLKRQPIQVSLSIAGRQYSADLETQTRIPADADGLSQALADGPGLFAWWASLEAWARAQAELAEKVKDTCYAELYTFHEAALSRTVGDKREKATVDRVRSAVVQDKRYQAAWDNLIKANEAAGLAQAGRRAMEQRKEALLAVASNYRAELDVRLRDSVKAMRSFMRGQA